MKTRSIFTAAVSSIALLVAAAHAGHTGTGVEPAARPATADESRPKTGKPMLEKGMTAETILQLVGKPAEIAPVAAGEGKAEMWTYRRLIDTKHLLDATTVETIPVFLRATAAEGNVMGTATRPIYNLKHITTYQVTALLMYEGRLVIARQWQERSQSYDN